MSAAEFWQDNLQAGKVVRHLKNLKSVLEPWQETAHKYQELKELSGLLGHHDRELASQIDRELVKLRKKIDELEFKTVLGGEFDQNNAILSINAGAGGTESCDWAKMLLRMYSRFAEAKGYKVTTLDILSGEEAGIKNVTLLIEGTYAYGYLKAERGVHRLVRISPFDANKRRHTSFASVDAIPQIEEDIAVDLEEKDLRIDVYRSSGPGGQSVNTTDSAVRITHLPSGIVVQCQNERSQYQNKQMALTILRAKLYELEREKKEAEFNREFAAGKQKIEWGSQIRSYVLHPYSLVKDHRSGFEIGDVSGVLDGDLEGLINAYLKKMMEGKHA